MKVYLNITIGNLSKYEEECKAYELGKGFISKNASWVAEDLNEGEFLNNEKLNLLVEMVDNQPEYKDKLIQFNPPQKLKGGRLVFELDEKNCPKTSSNFYHLCKGDKGLSKPSKKPLHYLNTTLFRVVSGYIAQGGDITRGDGSGGDSIYNGKFNDEKGGLNKKFEEAGSLAMANSGKNSNTSQFFITLPTSEKDAYSKLNGKYVLFGRLTEGLEVLDFINQIPCNNEIPESAITITDCGTL